jgi:hypothetical protein
MSSVTSVQSAGENSGELKVDVEGNYPSTKSDMDQDTPTEASSLSSILSEERGHHLDLSTSARAFKLPAKSLDVSRRNTSTKSWSRSVVSPPLSPGALSRHKRRSKAPKDDLDASTKHSTSAVRRRRPRSRDAASEASVGHEGDSLSTFSRGRVRAESRGHVRSQSADKNQRSRSRSHHRGHRSKSRDGPSGRASPTRATTHGTRTSHNVHGSSGKAQHLEGNEVTTLRRSERERSHGAGRPHSGVPSESSLSSTSIALEKSHSIRIKSKSSALEGEIGAGTLHRHRHKTANQELGGSVRGSARGHRSVSRDAEASSRQRDHRSQSRDGADRFQRSASQRVMSRESRLSQSHRRSHSPSQQQSRRSQQQKSPTSNKRAIANPSKPSIHGVSSERTGEPRQRSRSLVSHMAQDSQGEEHGQHLHRKSHQHGSSSNTSLDHADEEQTDDPSVASTIQSTQEVRRSAPSKLRGRRPRTADQTFSETLQRNHSRSNVAPPQTGEDTVQRPKPTKSVSSLSSSTARRGTPSPRKDRVERLNAKDRASPLTSKRSLPRLPLDTELFPSTRSLPSDKSSLVAEEPTALVQLSFKSEVFDDDHDKPPSSTSQSRPNSSESLERQEPILNELFQPEGRRSALLWMGQRPVADPSMSNTPSSNPNGLSTRLGQHFRRRSLGNFEQMTDPSVASSGKTGNDSHSDMGSLGSSSMPSQSGMKRSHSLEDLTSTVIERPTETSHGMRRGRKPERSITAVSDATAGPSAADIGIKIVRASSTGLDATVHDPDFLTRDADDTAEPKYLQLCLPSAVNTMPSASESSETDSPIGLPDAGGGGGAFQRFRALTNTPTPTRKTLLANFRRKKGDEE